MAGKGHPRAFKDDQEFMDKFNEYIKECEEKEKLANIAGFCVFCDIHRDTFYAQNEYYSDTFKKVQAALEDAALNHKATTMGIFYLKNKFGYKDKQEIVSHNTNVEMSVEEAKEYLDSLSEEEKKKLLGGK